MRNFVAELRKQYRLTQEELAQSVGVTRQTITSIECGKYTASLVLAYKLASFFNVRIEQLFDFSSLTDEDM